jgi:hypothetical protein
MGAPRKTTSNGRFELPTLAPLESLTAGTDIPPPLESPTKEQPTAQPAAQPAPSEVSAVAEGAPVARKPQTPPVTRGHTPPTNGQAVPNPTSPRPNSIRRLFSRRSLYGTYNNGDNASQVSLGAFSTRPESFVGSDSTSIPGNSKKRSSSWFSRFTGGSNKTAKKRASTVWEEEPPSKKVDSGPPPPRLPELSQLKSRVANDGLGGDDLFKNIK